MITKTQHLKGLCALAGWGWIEQGQPVEFGGCIHGKGGLDEGATCIFSTLGLGHLLGSMFFGIVSFVCVLECDYLAKRLLASNGIRQVCREILISLVLCDGAYYSFCYALHPDEGSFSFSVPFSS